MPRQRSPDRDKAKEIYMQHKGNIPLNEIANQLDLSEGTIRGWKAKDKWDAELNGTLQSDIKKNTERSKQNMERSTKNKKKPSIEYPKNKVPLKKSDEANIKTNSPSPFARFGNQNAVGNRGGPGGPIRNKKALKNGEHETIFYTKFFTADILDDEEREILDADYDKYLMQYLLIDTLTIREKRILKRIKEVENTPGGMIHDSVTKNKGTLTTKFVKRSNDVPTDDKSSEESSEGEASGKDMVQTQDNNTHKASPVLIRVMQLEEALTRVQARKQTAIAQLHRMEMDDERLTIDYVKLEIYKQRISGKVDLDTLFDDDDLDIGLED